MRARLATLIVLGSSMTAFTARADDVEQAKRDYAEGIALFNAKKCNEAMPLLERSAKLSRSPNPRLLIARCLRDGGKRVEAATLFEEVEREAARLVMAGDKRYSSTVTMALNEGAGVRADLGTLHFKVTNAQIEVDGRAIEGTDVAVLHDPPTAKVTFVDAVGRHDQIADVVAGKETPITFDGVPKPEPPGPVIVDRPREHPPEPGGLPFWVKLATGGVAVAGLGTFTGFGIASEVTYGDLKDRCAPQCTDADRADADRGHTFQTVANVGLVVGLVFAAATTVLILKD